MDRVGETVGKRQGLCWHLQSLGLLLTPARTHRGNPLSPAHGSQQRVSLILSVPALPTQNL